MKLGKVAQINIGVANLKRSWVFYEKLGFQRIEESDNPYPWLRITDGQNLILLNQDGNRYVGLVYYSLNPRRRVNKLEQTGINIIQRRELEDQLMMAIFMAPGDLAVGLINFDPEKIPRPSGQPITKCGTFGEFAVPVGDFFAAVEFWRKLGFATLFENEDPYPWGIVSDENIVLGLHQNSEYGDEIEFKEPALTYFAPDMDRRIERIRNEGLSFERELISESGSVNNATLRGPDGESVFLFEGEI